MSEIELTRTDEAYPRKFGPYLLLSPFAHGGMGEVYLSKSGGIEGIDRLCVLKKLRPDVARKKEYLGRFIDEARVVVQLSHANIAHVFDVGAIGDEHYMAMEYVSGANAREIQMRAAQEEAHGLDPGLAGLIMSEMLEALDYAHRHKHPLTGNPLTIVHRDVSPQNIMVSFEGEVKLIDFGLAASELKEEQTESQVVMGKVAYMSPEQARGDPVDTKTDQFAAAMVLYELLAGERFYGDKSNYEIWQIVGRGGFVPRRFTALDPGMTRILSRALNADKNMRYPSCGDFKDDLDLYVRTQYPHATKRALRDMMERLFQRDKQAERDFLSQHADVSAAQVRFITPGKARSFVAEGSASSKKMRPAPVSASAVPQPSSAANMMAISEIDAASKAPGTSVTSDKMAAALAPDARTETAITPPEQMDTLDEPAPRPEGTLIIERDLTGAAVQAAFPRPTRVLAAAAVIIALLVVTIALLSDTSFNQPEDLAAEATNASKATTTPSPPEQTNAAARVPNDRRSSFQRRGGGERAARRARKDDKKPPSIARAAGTRRSSATAAPSPRFDEGKDAESGKPQVRTQDGSSQDPDVAMSITQSPRARLHADLQALLTGRYKGWKPDANDQQVRQLMNRCLAAGLLNTVQQKILNKGMPKQTMASVNVALKNCAMRTGS